MHIKKFWLQIVEFYIFYHLEQSLWILFAFTTFCLHVVHPNYARQKRCSLMDCEMLRRK